MAKGRMMESIECAGESDGATDVDEIFAKCSFFHLEKMSDNAYCIILNRGEKQLILFVGHWPRDRRKEGNLNVNIMENGLGVKWTKRVEQRSRAKPTDKRQLSKQN